MARASGFIVVFNRIPALMATVESNAQRAPKKVADKIAARARSKAPVDTGALKASITSYSIARGKEAQVVAEAWYAAYVELGTYKMAAQPFLYPAFEELKHELSLELMLPFK